MNASIESPRPAAARPPSKIATVLRVTSGNFLEMFDFFLYGLYASDIARAFFPDKDSYISLSLTFLTFWAGFLMRPLGAVILGAYIDRIGRRRGLILTLALMACGTVLMACVPSYAAIGILAPILVVAGRLLQGFSAGVELGGVSVYLSEMSTPGHRGFYVSWQSASQQAAIMVAAALGFAVNAWLAPGVVDAWGWRIPFFIGCMILPFVFYIRRSLLETEQFLARTVRPTFGESVRAIARNWPLIAAGMLMVVMTTVSFYLITVYTPTYGKSVLKLGAADALIVTFCVGLSNFILLPLMGALSDRVGRWPLLVTFTVLTLLTAYPVLHWLVAAPSFDRMLITELWLSVLYGGYNGAAVVALTEVVPPHVRTVGFSLAYALATAIFGGFTPFACTWLIQTTGDHAAPGYWMSGAAACGLLATFLLYRGVVKEQ